MKTFESTAIIAATREQAWCVLSDVMRWPEWLPTVTRVEPLDSSSLKIGARYRISQPKLGTVIWTVSELDSGNAFTWFSDRPGMRTVGSHIIDPVSPLQVKATLRIIISGFFSSVASLLMGGLTQDYLEREAKALNDTTLRLSGPNPRQI